MKNERFPVKNLLVFPILALMLLVANGTAHASPFWDSLKDQYFRQKANAEAVVDDIGKTVAEKFAPQQNAWLAGQTDHAQGELRIAVSPKPSPPPLTDSVPIVGAQKMDVFPLPGWLTQNGNAMQATGKILAILLICGLAATIWKYNAGRRLKAMPQAEDEFAPSGVNATPRLNRTTELRLQKNLHELALVQANILSLQNGVKVKTIYVTSCFNEEGKTTAAISMAHALSINKNKVLLVDGNPRAPILHTCYHTAQDPGLSRLLDNPELSQSDLSQTTFYPNLNLLPFGSTTTSRPNLLAENGISTFLKEYAQKYDYIIMDGHSMTGSDTSMIAAQFDAIVIVAQCEKTKWEIVKQASQRMTLMGGNVLGIVLNRRKFYIPNFIYKAL